MVKKTSKNNSIYKKNFEMAQLFSIILVYFFFFKSIQKISEDLKIK